MVGVTDGPNVRLVEGRQAVERLFPEFEGVKIAIRRRFVSAAIRDNKPLPAFQVLSFPAPCVLKTGIVVAGRSSA